MASAATKSENAGGAKVALTVGVESSKGSLTVSANGVLDKGQADVTADLSQVLAAGGLPGDGRSSCATARERQPGPLRQRARADGDDPRRKELGPAGPGRRPRRARAST